MNKFFVAAAGIVVSICTMLPASAADIDINLNVGATGVYQGAVAGALSLLDASASVDQIAGLGSIEGNWVDDVNSVVTATGIDQEALALALSLDPLDGIALAEILQAAALSVIDLGNVAGGADINSLVGASGINQTAIAAAGAAASAGAAVSQLAGVGTISVNVTP